jgi:hypothetical protein
MKDDYRTSALVAKTQDMIKLLNLHLRHFPRHEKYALSQELRKAAYGVYLGIVESSKRYHKKTSLSNLDIQHEQLRMLVNLAFKLGYYEYKDGKRATTEQEAFRRYTAISVLVNEVGKMVGGWLNSVYADKRAEA